MVTIDTEPIGARSLMVGADRSAALLVAWDAALRWRSNLMIAAGATIAYVPAEQLPAAAEKHYGSIPPAAKPGGAS